MSGTGTSQVVEGTNFVFGSSNKYRVKKLVNSPSVQEIIANYKPSPIKSRSVQLEPLSNVKKESLSGAKKSPCASPARQTYERFRESPLGREFIDQSELAPPEDGDELSRRAVFPQVISQERTRLWSLERAVAAQQKKLMEAAEAVSPLEWVLEARQTYQGFVSTMLELSHEIPQHRRIIAQIINGYEKISDALAKLVQRNSDIFSNLCQREVERLQSDVLEAKVREDTALAQLAAANTDIQEKRSRIVYLEEVIDIHRKYAFIQTGEIPAIGSTPVLEQMLRNTHVIRENLEAQSKLDPWANSRTYEQLRVDMQLARSNVHDLLKDLEKSSANRTQMAQDFGKASEAETHLLESVSSALTSSIENNVTSVNSMIASVLEEYKFNKLPRQDQGTQYLIGDVEGSIALTQDQIQVTEANGLDDPLPMPLSVIFLAPAGASLASLEKMKTTKDGLIQAAREFKVITETKKKEVNDKKVLFFV
jgi:hypothetical protein